MKIFEKKGLFGKLIFVLIILLIFNAIIPPNEVRAVDSIGGKLLKPIVDFILALADGILDVIHKTLFDMNTSLIRIDMDNSFLDFVITAIVAVVVIAVIAVAAFALVAYGIPALLTALAGKIGVTITGIVTAGKISAAAIGSIAVFSISGGVVAGSLVHSNFFRK